MSSIIDYEQSSESRNESFRGQVPQENEKASTSIYIHQVDEGDDQHSIEPLPDQEKGREGRRQSISLRTQSKKKKLDFTDLLCTPGASSYNNMNLMRRYQLLAGMIGKHRGKVEKKFRGVEGIIRQLFSVTTVEVPTDYGKVEMIYPRHSDMRKAIQHVIQMTPVRTNDSRIKLIHGTKKDTITYDLHRALCALNECLSNVLSIPLAITGNIVLPPTTVAWPLETRVEGKGLLHKPDDSNSNEAFFKGHEMKQIQAEELGRFRAIVKLDMVSRTRTKAKIETHGTGWLLDATTIVTSGHCVHSRGKRLVSVDVVMGYGTGNPISRPGTHVIVHWGWFRSYETGQDLALIRTTGFDGEHGLGWRPFPNDGRLKIFAIGYPSYTTEELLEKESRNSNMQRSEDEVQCQMAVKASSLRHSASTWSGSSGCPILDENDKVVAVHSSRRGSDKKKYNAAPVLDKQWNNIDDMKMTLDGFIQSSGAVDVEERDVVYRLDNDGTRLFSLHHV